MAQNTQSSLFHRDKLLLLPGDSGFNEILATPPPTAGADVAFVVRPGGNGLIEGVSLDALDDYLQSGEYDERIEEIEAEEPSSLLYLPCEVVL